jgi:hypothetical protein
LQGLAAEVAVVPRHLAPKVWVKVAAQTAVIHIVRELLEETAIRILVGAVGVPVAMLAVMAVLVLSSSNIQTLTAQLSAAVSHKPPQPQAATKSAQ